MVYRYWWANIRTVYTGIGIPVWVGKYTNSAYWYRWANIQTVDTGIAIPVLVGKYTNSGYRYGWANIQTVDTGIDGQIYKQWIPVSVYSVLSEFREAAATEICRPSFTILHFTTNKLNHLKRISPVLLNLFWRLNLELLETKAMRYQFYCLKVLKQALVPFGVSQQYHSCIVHLSEVLLVFTSLTSLTSLTGHTTTQTNRPLTSSDDTIVKPDPDSAVPGTQQADTAGPSNRVLLGAPPLVLAGEAGSLEEEEYREFRDQDEADFFHWRICQSIS